MTTLYVDRTKNEKYFNQDNYFGARHERGRFYDLMQQTINRMIKSKDSSYFSKLMDIAFEYSELLIREGNYSEAFNNYFQIYCNAIHGNFMEEDQRNFINSIDKVELYYNLGVISKDYIKDFDNAMYYFGEAGKEFSYINRVSPEEFFRKEMIDKEGSPFWNFSGSIHQNCFGYMPIREFQYISVFGGEADKSEIQNLLKDFNYPLLLQFVFTIYSYYKWLPLRHNEIKGIKISRIIGEMAWLFECYLKQKLTINGHDGLNTFLELLVNKNKRIQKPFLLLRETEVYNKDNITALENLIKLQETSSEPNKKQAICLLTTYVLRNYSSHNVDDKIQTFHNDKYTKKLFYSSLMSFFVVSHNIK